MTDFSPTDPLARAAEELGDPDAVYAVGPARVGTKLLVAGGLLLYGVVANVWWWGFGLARFDHLILLVLFAPPLTGLSMLRHLARARGTAVAAYPTGLLRVRGDEVESYPWADVEVFLRSAHGEVRAERDEKGLVACWVEVEPPLMKFWDAGVTLRRPDGTETTLTPALGNYAELAERVQRATFAAQWPDVRRRFRAGDPVAFGKFAADLEGLTFGEMMLPWEHFGKFEIGQGKVSVKLSGKWMPWAVTDFFAVPNPHLLLAVVEEMKSDTASSS